MCRDRERPIVLRALLRIFRTRFSKLRQLLGSLSIITVLRVFLEGRWLDVELWNWSIFLYSLPMNTFFFLLAIIIIASPVRSIVGQALGFLCCFYADIFCRAKLGVIIGRERSLFIRESIQDMYENDKLKGQATIGLAYSCSTGSSAHAQIEILTWRL